MINVTGTWLTHPGTQEVLTRLEAAGFAAFAVGGCVRNALMGVPVADVDLATDARPEQVIAACDGLKTVPTGIDHGTVTIIAQGAPHEVTTFRRDVETDGRHAKVAFGTSITEDAARRDFTMNALYANAAGEVFDPLETGLTDLETRQVRFIGDAETRIREDALRILRFFRFTAYYGLALDRDGLAACAQLQERIDGLSRERVGQEMSKLLTAPDPSMAVAAMAQAGLLNRVIPGADAKALPILVHFEEDQPPKWQRRLALLGGDPGKLRLSKKDCSQVSKLAQMARDMVNPFTLGFELGTDLGQDALLIRSALLENPQDTTGLSAGASATFPLKASDLPHLQGPPLGKALAAARGHWLSKSGTPDARALLAWLNAEK